MMQWMPLAQGKNVGLHFDLALAAGGHRTHSKTSGGYVFRHGTPTPLTLCIYLEASGSYLPPPPTPDTRQTGSPGASPSGKGAAAPAAPQAPGRPTVCAAWEATGEEMDDGWGLFSRC